MLKRKLWLIILLSVELTVLQEQYPLCPEKNLTSEYFDQVKHDNGHCTPPITGYGYEDVDSSGELPRSKQQ